MQVRSQIVAQVRVAIAPGAARWGVGRRDGVLHTASGHCDPGPPPAPRWGYA